MLSDYFPPHSGGGVERVVYELARMLAHQRFTVGVTTLNTLGAPSEETIDGVSVWRLRGYSLTALLGLQSAWSPTLFRDALHVCRIFRPDVIHAHNLFFATSLTAPWLKWKVGSPLVTSMHLGSLDHVPGISGTLARSYEAVVGKWILRHSDHVTAVSESVRQHGLHLGVHPQRIQTIENGVQMPTPGAAPPAPSSPQRVVFVGRLIVNKGPHIFIEAASRILATTDDVEFVLAGDGPMRRALESQVIMQGLGSRIRFLGFQQNVPEILRQATLFVRPSLLEGHPLTVLEAMACGVPVIASRIAGNVDLIQHGKTGILTPAGDASALSQAIVTLLQDADARGRLAANARRIVERHRGWDLIADQFAQVYQGALLSGSRSLGGVANVA